MIKTAVLPVAGLGTRIMPLTLHQPKAMIGIVDRPMIHYVIDEALAAGIRHIVLVTGPNQPEFKKYITYLKEKDPEWQKLDIQFDFAIQKKPLGNGDAIVAAKKFLKQEPFAVSFSDDLLTSTVPSLEVMTKLFQQLKGPIVALEPVPRQHVSRYGVVKSHSIDNEMKDICRITDVVEKPKTEEAPSNLTIIGRYILTPEILEILESLYPFRGTEIGLANALKIYAQQGNALYGWRFRGKRFDAGSKLGILKAQTHFGLTHPDLKKEFKKYLKGLEL